MRPLWLHRFAVALALCTFLVILAGASVTSRAGSGLRAHYTIAGTVGMLTAILAICLWRSDTRRWMRILSLVALLAVLAQAALGGAAMALHLPKALGFAHACLAQLVFSTMVAIAVFTSRSWMNPPSLVEDSGWPSLRSLAVATPITVLAQVILGAAYRHNEFGVMPHILGSIVVTALILMVSIFVLAQFGTHAVLRRYAMALIGITCLQVVLGIVAFLGRASSPNMQSPELVALLGSIAHVATGALTVAASIALALEVLRNVRPRLSEAAAHLAPAAR